MVLVLSVCVKFCYFVLSSFWEQVCSVLNQLKRFFLARYNACQSVSSTL